MDAHHRPSCSTRRCVHDEKVVRSSHFILFPLDHLVYRCAAEPSAVIFRCSLLYLWRSLFSCTNKTRLNLVGHPRFQGCVYIITITGLVLTWQLTQHWSVDLGLFVIPRRCLFLRAIATRGNTTLSFSSIWSPRMWNSRFPTRTQIEIK